MSDPSRITVTWLNPPRLPSWWDDPRAWIIDGPEWEPDSATRYVQHHIVPGYHWCRDAIRLQGCREWVGPWRLLDRLARRAN